MKEIKKSRELTKIEMYLMTQAPTTLSMKELDDNVSLPVDAWLLFEKSDELGNTTELLAILSNSQAYVTQSGTFKKDFLQIADIMGEESYSIQKISGVTKAGREYIDCVLDITSVK